MTISTRRVRAIFRKELREYRRNRQIVISMAILPLLFLFAQPGIASALLQGPGILAQLLFTPLLAGWSIWVGIAISTRSRDIRVAQQLGMLASLPSVAVTSLIAFNVIPVSLGLAAVSAAALVILNRLGWRVTAAALDRERLITGG